MNRMIKKALAWMLCGAMALTPVLAFADQTAAADSTAATAAAAAEATTATAVAAASEDTTTSSAAALDSTRSTAAALTGGTDQAAANTAANSATFNDISGHWAESIIEEAYAMGIVNGYEDGSFRPNNTITREEFYKLIVSILTYTYDTENTVISFTDLKASGWYVPYIRIAVAAQLTNGYEDGTFGIGRNITRQEAAKAAGSLLQNSDVAATAGGVETAADVSQIADWALPYVDLLYKKGYIGGDETGCFRPTASLTRAEATKIILGIKKGEKEIGPVPADLPVAQVTTGEAVDSTIYETNDCTETHGKNQNVFNEGRGTRANPYVIKTEYQLNHIREHLEDDCYYVLANDIAITQTFTTDEYIKEKDSIEWSKGNFRPLGSDQVPFKGVFDGQGHTISGLTMKGTYQNQENSADYTGLFGYLAENSEIKNLTISDSIITGGTYVGAVAGYSKGIITNCCCGKGNEITGNSCTGGICGVSETAMQSCTNNGIVESKLSASGGIVGELSVKGTAATECINNGTVLAGSGAGGIIGMLRSTSGKETEVNNCSNIGVVQSESLAGGIIGETDSSFARITVTSCKNSGSLSGNGSLGGIVGKLSEKATVTQCVNYGMAGGTKGGGIVGESAGTINYCYNKGEIAATSYSGGICAYNTGDLTRCYNDGIISATGYAGGIAGKNTGTIQYVYNSDDVFSSKYAGGLCGEAGGSFRYSYNAGTVTSDEKKGTLAGKSIGQFKCCYWLNQGSDVSSIGEGEANSQMSECRQMSEGQMMGTETLYGMNSVLETLNSQSPATPVWEYISDYNYPHLVGLKRE